MGKIKYRIVIDTETCPYDNTLDTIMGSNMLCYDIAWVVTDRSGKVYERRAYVNYDIYALERVRMKSAYYASKLPLYETAIKNGEMELKRMSTIRRTFFDDISNYGVVEVFAHNMRFDLSALNKTMSHVTKQKYHRFFPRNTDICDTMKMARNSICATNKYKEWCTINGFMTNHPTPRPRVSAEVIHAYLIDDPNYQEEHIGIEDALIEKDIMVACFKTKKKIDYKL